MKKTTLFLFSLLLISALTHAQALTVKRADPTNWWVGMKNSKLQIMLYGTDLKGASVSIRYPGVTVRKVNTVENPNYLFVDLNIAPQTKAGSFTIELSKRQGAQTLKTVYPYTLKKRDQRPQTIDSRDFIYLIMPDRFANGDPSNDKFADMADTASDRRNPYLRHGGDLQGVTQHLDYLKDLGVTAIWLNPVIENNQYQTNEGGAMRSAYHGYGFTDHYNVDKRLGGNQAYKTMIEAAHAKGIKVIQDAVYNHVGINHWFLKDQPMKDWLNQWDSYTNTSYRDEAVVDIVHGNKSDFKVQQNGWFVPFLPDLNHHNPFVATYLIQHALWTIEYFGVDGWRIDTYQYNDLEFMNRCNAALLEEYPGMFITGENAVHNPVSQAFFTQNNLKMDYRSNLPSPNDFVLYDAVCAAFNEKFGWSEGLNRLYTALSYDLIYKNPDLNMTFLDNHDQNRFYSVMGEDMGKYKMGIGFLLTTRGVPQLYYGTEVLMKNFKNPSDAEVRQDFPGGWPSDPKNKFTAAGRNAQENEAFDFVRKLAQYRKTCSALQTGKLIQYLPKDGIYVYFRQDKQKTVMVVMGQNEQTQTLDTKRFAEQIGAFKKGKNVLTDAVLSDIATIEVRPMSIQVIELMP